MPETTSQLNVPAFSVDMHFNRVPNLREVNFDAERCAALFTHPKIGIKPEAVARIHVYLRPDYKNSILAKNDRHCAKKTPTIMTMQEASKISSQANHTANLTTSS